MISTGGIHRSAQSRMHVAWLSEGGGGCISVQNTELFKGEAVQRGTWLEGAWQML